jgi:CRP-like cAMP-binding protein
MTADASLDLLFKRIELHGGISEDEKAILAAAVDRTLSVQAKQDIVREGERPKQCTVLLSGFVVRYRLIPSGGRQITAVHVPGDFIDLQSFSLKLMDHSLGALTECYLATMPHTALMQITETQPHLTRALWKLSLLDSALHREWIVAMGAMPSRSHLAHLFCEMYLRLESVGLAGDYTFHFPITQDELADTLGISPVHVNRVLQELRAEGVIQFDGKVGTILDWDRLVEIGQFDDKHLHLHDDAPVL